MASSHTNLSYLRTPQRSLRCTKRRNEVKAQKNKIMAFKNKIEKLINNGIRVDKHLHDDLSNIMGSIDVSSFLEDLDGFSGYNR